MFTVKEDTTLVGISELRTKFSKVLEALEKHKVLLERRNKPIAVILAIEKYEQMEKLIELIEDVGLGHLAMERHRKSNSSDYIDLDKVEKKLKVKK